MLIIRCCDLCGRNSLSLCSCCNALYNECRSALNRCICVSVQVCHRKTLTNAQGIDVACDRVLYCFRGRIIIVAGQLCKRDGNRHSNKLALSVLDRVRMPVSVRIANRLVSVCSYAWSTLEEDDLCDFLRSTAVHNAAYAVRRNAVRIRTVRIVLQHIHAQYIRLLEECCRERLHRTHSAYPYRQSPSLTELCISLHISSHDRRSIVRYGCPVVHRGLTGCDCVLWSVHSTILCALRRYLHSPISTECAILQRNPRIPLVITRRRAFSKRSTGFSSTGQGNSRCGRIKP